jgi:hypothetical protein
LTRHFLTAQAAWLEPKLRRGGGALLVVLLDLGSRNYLASRDRGEIASRPGHRCAHHTRPERRVLEGEKMAKLRREFEILRKTSYRIFQRYKDLALEA